MRCGLYSCSIKLIERFHVAQNIDQLIPVPRLFIFRERKPRKATQVFY